MTCNPPCGTKFFRVVLIFAIFSSDQQNKCPQIKITADIFPAKIYSTVNVFLLKLATQKYSTNKSNLFNYNLSLSFRNKTVYDGPVGENPGKEVE